MPFAKAAISAGVTVTATTSLLGPPLASRSVLTPRDPPDDTDWLLFLSVPTEDMPPMPNLLPDDPSEPVGAGMGVYVMFFVYRAATMAVASSFCDLISLVRPSRRACVSGCDANRPLRSGWFLLRASSRVRKSLRPVGAQP